MPIDCCIILGPCTANCSRCIQCRSSCLSSELIQSLEKMPSEINSKIVSGFILHTLSSAPYGVAIVRWWLSSADSKQGAPLILLSRFPKMSLYKTFCIIVFNDTPCSFPNEWWMMPALMVSAHANSQSITCSANYTAIVGSYVQFKHQYPDEILSFNGSCRAHSTFCKVFAHWVQCVPPWQ